jgi:response regulator RpfG family c-di-GMP phosphodiesterase
MDPALHFILIDDSKLDCFITEKIIQSTGICAGVKSFLEAAIALDYIKNNPASADGAKVILMVDIYMPLMNGFEFIEEFEKLSHEIRDLYSIFILSSSINENDQNRAANYKTVKHFLNKPLNGDFLVSLLT